VDQGGHGVYELKTNTCANDTVTAWLADGTFPAGDVSCPAEPAAAALAPLAASNRSVAAQQMLHRMRPF